MHTLTRITDKVRLCVVDANQDFESNFDDDHDQLDDLDLHNLDALVQDDGSMLALIHTTDGIISTSPTTIMKTISKDMLKNATVNQPQLERIRTTNCINKLIPIHRIQLITQTVSKLHEIYPPTHVRVDAALKSVSIDVDDCVGGIHTITAMFPETIVAQDDIQNHLKWFSDIPASIYNPNNHKSIMEIVSAFSTTVSKLDPLWKQLHLLDTNAHATQASTPSFTSRRIVVSQTLQIEIELDPIHPFEYPLTLSIHGKENDHDNLSRQIQSHKHEWLMDCDILVNIERLIGHKLPMPTSISQKQSMGDCGICLSYILPSTQSENDSNGDPPSIHCSECATPFHRSCLVQWYTSVPGTRRGLYLLIGECPECGHSIPVEVGIHVR